MLTVTGIGPASVSTGRDKELRKVADPLDPSNRRITLFVQYIVTKADEESPKPAASRDGTAENKPAGH
jgi:hypothetical protein